MRASARASEATEEGARSGAGPGSARPPQRLRYCEAAWKIMRGAGGSLDVTEGPQRFPVHGGQLDLAARARLEAEGLLRGPPGP
jgi:hypothetical protein